MTPEEESKELRKRVEALRACFDDRVKEINACLIKIEATVDRMSNDAKDMKFNNGKVLDMLDQMNSHS